MIQLTTNTRATETDRAVRISPEGKTVSKALEDIAAERRRQIETEGWTSEHDDEHDSGALSAAAASYAYRAALVARNDYRFGVGYPPPMWPGWATKWWNPKDRRRDLVRAAALIVAEIERLDRRAALSPAPAVQEGKA